MVSRFPRKRADNVMNLPDELESRLRSFDLFRHGTLLAVSGGADSVALLEIVRERMRRVETVSGIETGAGAETETLTVAAVRDRVAVAHLNHGFRGEASDADAEFVRALAEEAGLPFYGKRLDPKELARGHSGSFEAEARRARYDFLRHTAEQLGFRYVATAHNRDDQVETVLQRILRGTGPAGLAGMSEARPLSEAVSLIRPLLTVGRAEILEYLRSIDRSFRQDASNTDNRMTRNRIRNVLVPLLRDSFNPRVEEAVLRLAAQAREERNWLEAEARRRLEKALVVPPTLSGHDIPGINEAVALDVDALRNKPAVLVREVLVLLWKRRDWPLGDMGTRDWHALLEMLETLFETPLTETKTESREFSGGIRVEGVRSEDSGNGGGRKSLLVFRRKI